MSQDTESLDQRTPLGLQNGLEALRSDSEFGGPGDSLDDHEPNQHVALIYETPEEWAAAAVPFVRQGLERGERCVYVLDEHSQAEVTEAMRTAGIDVAAALESGALTFHTVRETYLRNGTFDADETLAFYAEAIEAATAEHEGLRVTAETGWILDDGVEVEEFMAYESRVNDLFEGEDVIALCQYDRERFPPDVLNDIIETHPHLIYDNTVCHNVYYTPPEEFLGPARPDREIDRKMRTLTDRAEARSALRERQRYLQRQNRITADPNRSFEEKLQALFDLGCERFGLELGGMARVDVEDDRFEVEYVSDEHEHFKPGVELPLSETYCTAATEIRSAATVSEPREEGYDDIHVYRKFGIKAYLGTYIAVDGDPDRTFFFFDTEPREGGFADDEIAFLRLMSQWVKYELEQRRRERDQRTLYEIAADADRGFEEKLQALFDLGCERFDLELGGIARVDPETDLFEVEAVRGDHEHLVPGARVALSETYCRVIAEDGGTAGVSDPESQGFEGTTAHDEFGVNAYLGTRIDLEDDDDRTLFFVSTEPRERPFSEADRTFQHLMGQWVKYELEQRGRQQALMESEQRYRTLAENFPEGVVALFDEDLRYTAVGGQLLDQVGRDPEDVIGRRIFELYPDDLAEEVEPHFRAALDGETTSFETEFRNRHMLAYTLPIRDADDEVFAGMLVAQDVTERKEREQRLEKFASVVSHGLRNPLGIAQMYTSMAREDGDPESFAQVEQALDRMETIIQNLLTTTVTGQKSESGEPVSVAQVVEDAWRSVDTEDASLEVDEPAGTLLADEDSLQSALENLIRNAVDYGGAGVTVRIGPLEDGFYVEDTGPGIPPENRPKAFEYGYTSQSGTGIGLAVVRDIVEAHGWEIDATDAADGGARFEIRGADVTFDDAR